MGAWCMLLACCWTRGQSFSQSVRQRDGVARLLLLFALLQDVVTPDLAARLPTLYVLRKCTLSFGLLHPSVRVFCCDQNGGALQTLVKCFCALHPARVEEEE